MAKRQKILLSWSGGKDSVVSLFELKSPDYKLLGLLTAVTADNKIKTHQVPLELLEAQAESLELPLITVSLSNDSEYEAKMEAALKPMKNSKLEGVAFGDINLEAVRNYRDQFFPKLKLGTHYPIWGWKPQALLKAFLGLGYKAIVVRVDTRKLPSTFVGRLFDWDFVEDLPQGVDPTGENGEFHTFVYDGPFFQTAVPFELGAKHQEGDFAFQELKLSKSSI
ncbi:MAG: ATP-binding protein [Deltaproteobacteria bacterium]|nr:ATP-binding protein [Deltaproteobacteria bacterium]